VTAANGEYFVPNLPPGDYTMTLAREGMETQTRLLTISAAQTVASPAWLVTRSSSTIAPECGRISATAGNSGTDTNVVLPPELANGGV